MRGCFRGRGEKWREEKERSKGRPQTRIGRLSCTKGTEIKWEVKGNWIVVTWLLVVQGCNHLSLG